MKRRGAWQPRVLVAAALASSACSTDNELRSRPQCSGSQEALAPGELVQGQDPAALFAPYWGSLDGTLSWEDGGETALTLTLRPGTDADVYTAPLCETPSSVYTYPELELKTQDGGLDETDTAIVIVPLPGKQLDALGGVLAPSGIPDWQWRGAVEPHLPSNNAGYTQRGLEPVIAWAPGDPQPESLLLYFSGQPSGTTLYDRILIASGSFR